MPKTTLTVWPFLSVLSIASAQSSIGTNENRRFEYGFEADFNSIYVWRGIVLDNKPLMEASAWVSAFGFTITAWDDASFSQTPDQAGLHSAGLDLSYGREWHKLKIEPAIESYLNRPPAGMHDPNTAEGSFKLSYPVGPLRIFTKHAFDLIAYRGSYFGEAGVGYERPIKKLTTVAVTFDSGWASSTFNDVYIGLKRPGFNFIEMDGSLTYHLKHYLYFQSHVEFSNIVNQELRKYLSWPAAVNIGLAVGFDFDHRGK